MREVFEGGARLEGSVKVPGDKSISHRAAIIGAISSGDCRLSGFSPAADCASTITCLEALGVGIERAGGNVVIVGRGDGVLEQPGAPLEAGNSGTTMRLLAGMLACRPLTVTITGDESLNRRPMRRIIEPLELMGAKVRAGDAQGHPPLEITGGGLRAVDYAPDVPSAQVKSAVLLAGLGAEGTTSVIESVKTRDHTERMLASSGIGIHVEGLVVSVEPGVPRPLDLSIPGDISSAAFLITAALLCPGSRVAIEDVGLNPTRTGFLSLLMRMGADIEIDVQGDDGWEPRGTVRARHSTLRAVDIDAADVVGAIDEIPLIALLATRAEGTTRITGAGELRHKESDRIAGTVKGLKSLGACIDETEDGVVIEGPARLRGAAVSGTRDHRLAMLFGVAGLIADGSTLVEDWEWTEISYPGFAETIGGLIA